MSEPNPVDPSAAIALAAAAGLDISDLRAQVERRAAGRDPDALWARIADLEKRVAAATETAAAPSNNQPRSEPHEQSRDSPPRAWPHREGNG